MIMTEIHQNQKYDKNTSDSTIKEEKIWQQYQQKYWGS